MIHGLLSALFSMVALQNCYALAICGVFRIAMGTFNHLRAMSGCMGDICASGKHYLAVMENDKVCLKLRLVKDIM
jgi:hypothetical protein